MLAGGILDHFRARGRYRGWRRPRRFDRNLIVIGAGSAGLVSAYIAATVKARVTLVEAKKMGGDCLNYGCVPSKALIKSARVAWQMRRADRYGLAAVEPHVDFRRVMGRVQEIIRRIEPHDSVERYTGLGVEVLAGHARITSPWTVEVALRDGGTRTLTTRAIVIAAGAEPVVPPLPGLAELGYLTTDTLWDEFSRLDTAPRRLMILGGGPVGCELAQALSRLGSEVTLLQRSDRLLPREDQEVSAAVRAALEADGVRVLTGHRALACEERDGEKTVLAESPTGKESLAYDVLICAVGRQARLGGYGLEELGIDTGRTVLTNGFLQTAFPNIYAAGDVAGPFQLTHAASHQAWYAAVNALFGEFRTFKADYSVIPRTTFTDPEVAHVGLNEQQARQQGVACEITRYDLAELDRAVADSAAGGFVKVLTVPGKDRILGATIVGEQAGELLAEFVLAMKHGLGLNRLLGTIHSYPTLAEANKLAAGQWKRVHAPEKLLRLVQRYHDWKRG